MGRGRRVRLRTMWGCSSCPCRWWQPGWCPSGVPKTSYPLGLCWLVSGAELWGRGGFAQADRDSVGLGWGSSVLAPCNTTALEVLPPSPLKQGWQ